MDYFEEFAENLPDTLPAPEQEKLLQEYYKTRDQDIREKLLTHNLKMCLMVARRVCLKYNKPSYAGDAFSVCYQELSNSLEKYDPHHEDQVKFSTYAINNMELVLNRTLNKELSLTYPQVDTVFIQDYEEQDWFTSFYDQSESNIAEDAANKAFVEDIIKFINKIPVQRQEIIKMYLGLDYPRRYTQVEIAKMLGTTRQNISLIINTFMPKLKTFIIENYPTNLPSSVTVSSIAKAKVFDSQDARNQYIFESYYGINGKQQKSTLDLSNELFINQKQIQKIAYELKNQMPANISNSIERSRINSAKSQDLHENIFNDFYGLNGSTILDSAQISQKYGIHKGIMKYVDQKFIDTGKYTKEEIKELKANRKLALRNKVLNRYAYAYFSYYGINGYTKKSLVQLTDELHITYHSAADFIQLYKKHLASLSAADREAEIAKYAKNTQSEPEN